MTTSSSPNRPPEGTVVAVAPLGGHVAVTADDVARAATDCARIGACVVDVEPRADCPIADQVAAARREADVLVRVSAYARTETLTALLEAGADIVTGPMDAPAEFLTELRQRSERQGLPVHYEARNLEQVARLRSLPAVEHAVLVFGDSRGMPGTVETIAEALHAVPESAAVTATGLGSVCVPVMLTALAASAHVRTGLADSWEYSEGVAAKDDAQLVARAAGLAKIAQRPAVGAAEARTLLTSRATA
ncbi:hypothetical protein GIY23_21560 [Allosaccharopolyspora coralli]|uniref:3-keto-5-aminohexanoate cleavage protein n=1 Tax=Allosaccharopolyspora coralli TaxID=2665642 RepID=A0A5Q3QB18_9PSEU|nr:3-keto-5-aminohexanoate cleavage protein [Allosaccharopolyspora coralli]QGK71758.1 hypothetical protein GIY23_21560 [Allosaccharopolyspora coralli]